MVFLGASSGMKPIVRSLSESALFVNGRMLLHCLSVKERQVQAGCKHQLVLLFSSGRVGDIDVTKIVLPS